MSGGDIVSDYLDHRFRFRPVDATFMGAAGHDDRLPPVGEAAIAEELAGVEALAARIEAAGDLHPHDRALLSGELAVEAASLRTRPRQFNPAWYTGEAGFGVISLLLPQSAPWRGEAIAARIAAIPAFLDAGARLLDGRAVPAGWVRRASSEATALAEWLTGDIRLHDAWQPGWSGIAEAAAQAFRRFATALEGLPDADPACGTEHLALVMARQHMLDLTPDEAVAKATEAFARTTAELERMASEIDPGTPWPDQIAALSLLGPKCADEVIESYREWHDRAIDAATGLVTPETGYGLDYRYFPPWFEKVAKSLYFLFYRSPPGLNPGTGSVYWVGQPGADRDGYLAANNTATVKAIHSVHHGSVGHHTQNARARAAGSALARIAGTDCAMGLAFLGAGTLIEGWACHVEDLLMEADGFYTPAEKLLLKSFERRNAASVMVDVNIHTGRWSLAEAARFYAEEAGFAPARVEGEIIRNSMFPGSRLMYWLGVEGIRDLRRRWRGDARAFHDTLLSFGHVPLALVASEMEKAGQLDG